MLDTPTQYATLEALAHIGGMMNLSDFVQAVAETIDRSDRIVLADEPDIGPGPVNIVWGLSCDHDTILVRTSDGDVFRLKVDVLHTDAVPA